MTPLYCTLLAIRDGLFNLTVKDLYAFYTRAMNAEEPPSDFRPSRDPVALYTVAQNMDNSNTREVQAAALTKPLKGRF